MVAKEKKKVKYTVQQSLSVS